MIVESQMNRIELATGSDGGLMKKSIYPEKATRCCAGRVPNYPRLSWKRTWKVDCVRDDGESDHPEWLCVSEVRVDFPNSLEDQGGARPDGLDVHNCLWVWASATFREKGRHRSVVYDLLYAVFKFRIRSGSSLAQFYSASFFQPKFVTAVLELPF